MDFISKITYGLKTASNFVYDQANRARNLRAEDVSDAAKRVLSAPLACFYPPNPVPAPQNGEAEHPIPVPQNGEAEPPPPDEEDFKEGPEEANPPEAPQAKPPSNPFSPSVSGPIVRRRKSAALKHEAS